MTALAFGSTEPLPRMLRRPKSLWQSAYDLIAAPLRMALLPDAASERLGLTSLRCERLAAALPVLQGRVLDVGAGDNLLVRMYRREAAQLGIDKADADSSVGVDVHDWGFDCLLVPDAGDLPFEAATFDTVSFVACLNHIPERNNALREASRVLKPGGRLVITMIGVIVGAVGHTIWWYSEDKNREVAPGERWGLSRREIRELLDDTGFTVTSSRTFLYGLNTLHIAVRSSP